MDKLKFNEEKTIKMEFNKLTSDGEKASPAMLDAAEKYLVRALKQVKGRLLPWVYVLYIFNQVHVRIFILVMWCAGI